MTLYENIKKFRNARGISQEELAKLMGYRSRASINKIEMGKADIPQSRIAQFARILGVSPGELMGWEPSPAARKKMAEDGVWGPHTANAEPNPLADRPVVVASGKPMPGSSVGSLTGYINYLYANADPETKEKLPIIVEGQIEKTLIENYRSLSDRNKRLISSLIQSLPKDTER